MQSLIGTIDNKRNERASRGYGTWPTHLCRHPLQRVPLACQLLALGQRRLELRLARLQAAGQVHQLGLWQGAGGEAGAVDYQCQLMLTA